MGDSITGDKKSVFEWKTLTAIGAATWMVTSAGCSSEQAEPEEAVGETSESEPIQALAAAGEGEAAAGEGEGEGEGEGAGGADPAVDDAAFLTQLGLIRGHLQVGYELYDRDLPELAETHMKHPREEIYSALEPAFGTRGCAGFGDNLVALTASVVERTAKADVKAAYEGLLAGIRACEETAALDDAVVAANVIVNLVRTAGVEYEIGVIDGEIDNLHEYQDAWGFTQVAKDYAASPAFAGDAAAIAAAAQISDILAGLDDLWPSLDPQAGVDGQAGRLFGASSEIEIAALGVAGQ